MILPFSTQLNRKPTFFVEKILIGIDKNLGTYHTEQFLKDYKVKFESKTPVNFNSKIHTIREDKTSRWKPGILIDFFINCRQKNMFRFAPRVPVVSVQRIILEFDDFNFINVFIDGRFLELDELLEFIKNDGFDNYTDFHDYFFSQMEKLKHNTLRLKIIHWTNFKY